MGLLDIFKKKREPIHFEEIDSIEKAKEACKKRKLERMYVISPVFGGAKDDSNVLYVPVGVKGLKDCYDVIIEGLVAEGHAKTFDCTPEYRGNSVVPCKLTIVSGKDGKEVYRQTIAIW